MQIKAYRLSDLVHDYNMEADILKMDCEGCEYDIILKDYETVRRFNELVFEYHAYETKTPIDQLINKLNKDFTCKSVKGEFYSKYFPGYSRDLLGMIHCVKH